jgi:hypothetical protein
MVASGKNEDSTKVLRRYEEGERRPDRETLLAILLQGLGERETKTINRFLKEAGYEVLRQEELVLHSLPGQKGPETPQAQRVRWAPVDGRSAGIVIDGRIQTFLPWRALKMEVEQKLLNQLGRLVPTGCTAVLREFRGRKDWTVRILSPEGAYVGSIWFGPDPEKEWSFDGMVRAGHDDVWQVFQRFSDGSYRRLKAKRW